MHQKADREFIKLFSSLLRILEKSIASLASFQEIDDERSRKRKISYTISSTLLPRPCCDISFTVLRTIRKN